MKPKDKPGSFRITQVEYNNGSVMFFPQTYTTQFRTTKILKRTRPYYEWRGFTYTNNGLNICDTPYNYGCGVATIKDAADLIEKYKADEQNRREKVRDNIAQNLSELPKKITIIPL